MIFKKLEKNWPNWSVTFSSDVDDIRVGVIKREQHTGSLIDFLICQWLIHTFLIFVVYFFENRKIKLTGSHRAYCRSHRFEKPRVKTFPDLRNTHFEVFVPSCAFFFSAITLPVRGSITRSDLSFIIGLHFEQMFL